MLAAPPGGSSVPVRDGDVAARGPFLTAAALSTALGPAGAARTRLLPGPAATSAAGTPAPCGGMEGTFEDVAGAMLRGVAALVDALLTKSTTPAAVSEAVHVLSTAIDAGDLKRPSTRPAATACAASTLAEAAAMSPSEAAAATLVWADDPIVQRLRGAVSPVLAMPPVRAAIRALATLARAVQGVAGLAAAADGALLVPPVPLSDLVLPPVSTAAAATATRTRGRCPTSLMRASVAPLLSSTLAGVLGAAWAGDATDVPPHGGLPPTFILAVCATVGVALHDTHVGAGSAANGPLPVASDAGALSLADLGAIVAPPALALLLHGDLAASLTAARHGGGDAVATHLRLLVARDLPLHDLCKALQAQLHTDSIGDAVAQLSARGGAVLVPDARAAIEGGTVRILHPYFRRVDAGGGAGAGGSVGGGGGGGSDGAVEEGEGHGPRKELFAAVGTDAASAWEAWRPLPPGVTACATVGGGAAAAMLALRLPSGASWVAALEGGGGGGGAGGSMGSIGGLDSRGTTVSVLNGARLKLVPPVASPPSLPPLEVVVAHANHGAGFSDALELHLEVPLPPAWRTALAGAGHAGVALAGAEYASARAPLFSQPVPLVGPHGGGLHWPSARVRTATVVAPTPAMIARAASTGAMSARGGVVPHSAGGAGGAAHLGGSEAGLSFLSPRSAPTFANPRVGIRYMTIGWMLAAAVVNRCAVGLALPGWLAAVLLTDSTTPATLNDLEEVNPDTFATVMGVLAADAATTAALLVADDSVAEMDPSGGVRLVDAGESRLATGYSALPPSSAAARAAYVARALAGALWTDAHPHLKALRAGFRAAYGRAGGRVLNTVWQLPPSVLAAMWQGDASGVNAWDDAHAGVDLTAVFRIVYDEEARECVPLQRALWDVVNGWPLGKQRAFVRFVTGVAALPPPMTEALKVDTPFSAFGAKQQAKLLATLPQAHSCTNTLELPNYYAALEAGAATGGGSGGATRDALAARCRVIINERLTMAVEGSDGYGLDDGAGTPAAAGGARGRAPGVSPAAASSSPPGGSASSSGSGLVVPGAIPGATGSGSTSRGGSGPASTRSSPYPTLVAPASARTVPAMGPGPNGPATAAPAPPPPAGGYHHGHGGGGGRGAGTGTTPGAWDSSVALGNLLTEVAEAVGDPAMSSPTLQLSGSPPRSAGGVPGAVSDSAGAL